ncbi:SigE family RNA polymerase sigma factor [Cellulomonas sp. GbtcB1]|uniref:SigE family RNA polymerase sigma factor n=1 Tax=Cellulomonas sp. GbtcB1 TaxID=2824746 RepID=UPI001C30C244|nr:SigE family RNA polymerase sigma factor [Cellulomonas sp. GbtcB1]
MSSADGVDFLRERFEAAGHAPPAPAAPGSAADEVAPVALDRDRQFTEFVRQHQTDLLRTAWLLCGDRHQAEELVQQALVRTYSRWGHVRQRDPLGYTRRVLANLRVDHWRRRRREVLVAPDDVSPESTPLHGRSPGDRTGDRDQLVRALATLTPRQRRVVVLRHFLDLSEAEVAEDLGVSAGTVKSTASRAMAALRVVLSADQSPDQTDTGAARDGSDR